MPWVASLTSVTEQRGTVQVIVTYTNEAQGRTLVRDYNLHRDGTDVRRTLKQLVRDKVADLRDIDTERTDMDTRLGTDPRDWDLGP